MCGRDNLCVAGLPEAALPATDEGGALRELWRISCETCRTSLTFQ